MSADATAPVPVGEPIPDEFHDQGMSSPVRSSYGAGEMTVRSDNLLSARTPSDNNNQQAASPASPPGSPPAAHPQILDSLGRPIDSRRFHPEFLAAAKDEEQKQVIDDSISPADKHVMRRASTLHFSSTDVSKRPEAGWKNMPHKYAARIARDPNASNLVHTGPSVALSARGKGSTKKDDMPKEEEDSCFRNPLAPPGIHFRAPPRVPSSLQVRKLTLGSHPGLGLRLAPPEAISLAAISNGEFTNSTSGIRRGSNIGRERFLEMCPAEDALEVYYDGLFIRLVQDPNLAVEVRMFHTWEEYILHENACYSAGRSSRPFYRDAEKFQVGTEIQVFYHHRYANQMFVLNSDGSLSPKFKPDLCIGGIRLTPETENALLNARGGGGGQQGNNRPGMKLIGKGISSGALLEEGEHSGPPPQRQSSRNKKSFFFEGTHSRGPAANKGSTALSRLRGDGNDLVRQGGPQMQRGGLAGRSMTSAFSRSSASIDPEKESAMQLIKRQGTVASLSLMQDEEIRAMAVNDSKKMQRTQMERVREFPDANKIFLVKCQSPLEKLEDQMLMQRFHFDDVSGVPVTGLRDVHPETAIKVQLFTSTGVPLVIMQKVLGNVVYLGKHVKDIQNIEMIEALDTLLVSNPKDFTGEKTKSKPELRSPAGSSSASTENLTSAAGTAAGVNGPSTGAAASASSSATATTNGDVSSGDEREMTARESQDQYSTVDGMEKLTKRQYNPRVALEMEYKYSDKEMKAALARKVSRHVTRQSGLLLNSRGGVPEHRSMAEWHAEKKQTHREGLGALHGALGGEDPHAAGAAIIHEPVPNAATPREYSASTLADQHDPNIVLETGQDPRASTSSAAASPTANDSANPNDIGLIMNAEPDAEPALGNDGAASKTTGITVDREEDDSPAASHTNNPGAAAVDAQPPTSPSVPAADVAIAVNNTEVVEKKIVPVKIIPPAKTALGRFFQKLCGGKVATGVRQMTIGALMDVGSESGSAASIDAAKGFHLEQHDPVIRYFGELNYIARLTGRELKRMANFRVHKLCDRYGIRVEECIAHLLGPSGQTPRVHFSEDVDGLHDLMLTNPQTLAHEASKEAEWYLACDSYRPATARGGSNAVKRNKSWRPLEVYFSAKRRTMRLAAAPRLAIDCSDAVETETPLLCHYCTGADTQRFLVNPDGTVSPIYRRDLCWGLSKTGKIILVSALDTIRRLHIRVDDAIPLDESACRLGPERVFRFDLASHRGWGIAMKVGPTCANGPVGLTKHLGQKPVPTMSQDSVIEFFFDGPFLRSAKNPHAALCYKEEDHDVEFSAISNYADDNELHRYCWTLHPNRVITPQSVPEFCLGVSSNMRRVLLMDTEMLHFSNYSKGKHPILLHIPEKPGPAPQVESPSNVERPQRQGSSPTSSTGTNAGRLPTPAAARTLRRRATDQNTKDETPESALANAGPQEPQGHFDYGWWQAQNLLLHVQRKVANRNSTALLTGLNVRVAIWPKDWDSKLEANAFGELTVVEKEEAEPLEPAGKGFFFQDDRVHCVDNMQNVWTIESRDGSELRLGDRVLVDREEGIDDFAGGKVWDSGEFRDHQHMAFQRWELAIRPENQSANTTKVLCTISPLGCADEFAIGTDRHGFVILVSPESPNATVFRVELLDVGHILEGTEEDGDLGALEVQLNKVAGGAAEDEAAKDPNIVHGAKIFSPRKKIPDTMFRSPLRSSFDRQAYAATLKYFDFECHGTGDSGYTDVLDKIAPRVQTALLRAVQLNTEAEDAPLETREDTDNLSGGQGGELLSGNSPPPSGRPA
ncbi:unnamed protein product [Amoebophrya sp. A120]|nr:unnamed protein product [Amoebophrya sp. A120]|eukprot:GSA120T00001927001.1